MTREEAYDLVRPKLCTPWDNQVQFRPAVRRSTITSVLSKEEIDDAFDYHHHLKNVDVIFKRRFGIKKSELQNSIKIE